MNKLTKELLASWIICEDESVLVVDKPGWLVCHPSKEGPWSSLVGACRAYTELDCLHLVSRLDRETSGVVIMAKQRWLARALQMALQKRQVRKSYYALLEGELKECVEVDQPLARDVSSPVYIKQTIRKSRSSQRAVTRYEPIKAAGGYTLVRVIPQTGRKHQIRAHAAWIEHPIVGDKIYGPDATLYLEFINHGWTERLAQALPMKRQALHCAEMVFRTEQGIFSYKAPLANDMRSFAEEKLGRALN